MANITQWYNVACDSVKQWGVKTYGIEGKAFRLVEIHILFEQSDSDFIFGLQFNTDYDREHGCGVVMKGNTFDVIEVGFADVAYTWGA